ncbi:DNA-binding transcriptional regulator, LysR family [Tenacibaculum sp. MAR_2009_124]|uniref:LysR family transcriptional regulator n=1 Tax=Tenacibaculum sp. MAR_2009_124 TaxID=1250059 RepID=UPI00089BA154|nr:LysR family transcriptional regulator [Tenacibaculum sp. MAR_2009_124]SED06289.1 DNA-binding transcriptional regulator, LysR family [Tenacibaculum sp. MAR_2009_124]
MINLEWLRTFGVIYECHNITEASKKLNMTQPGVSKHLLALEAHIGKKLFERTTRKLTATEYGKFLYNQINTPLEQLKKVEHYSNQRASKTRHAISIGCTIDFFEKELVHKIYSFDMFITVQFGTEKELIKALEYDQVQLVVGVPKYNSYDHKFESISNDSFELVCSTKTIIPEQLIANRKKLNQWLQKQTWFVYDNDQKEIKRFWEQHFHSKPKIIPRYILPSYTNIIEALKTNFGFSIIPKKLGKEAIENNMIKIPIKLEKTMHRHLFYSCKSKNINDKEVKYFMNRLNDECQI